MSNSWWLSLFTCLDLVYWLRPLVMLDEYKWYTNHNYMRWYSNASMRLLFDLELIEIYGIHMFVVNFNYELGFMHFFFLEH